jgi:DNA-binding CsgD family transcriptional regulator/tetratricopeptide (TPR) repeat protein
MAVVTTAIRPFVGRRQELENLRQAYSKAAHSEGSVLFVAGDAGIGKTRLLQEWRSWLADQPATVGFGECLDYAQAPYAPFVDALRELLKKKPEALKNALAVRTILSAIVPELLATGQPAARATSKRQLFDAYVEALKTFAAVSPVVIAIEDLHWADSDSLDMALHLCSFVGQLRVVVVATYRRDEPGHEAFAATLARILRRPRVTTITLAPLTRSEMASFARAAVHGSAAPDKQAIERAITLSEGNPLFAEELLRHALGEARDSASLTLRTLVLGRLLPLNEEQRLILVYAAVIGRYFDPDLLAATSGKSLDVVMQALRLGRDNQLIVEDPAASYSFRHALVQEILCQELLVPEVQAVHAKIARALERSGSAAAHPIELAHHFWEAKEIAKATQYCEQAGDTAAEGLAFAVAANFYERAIGSIPASSHSDRSRLFEKLAEALFNSGMAERSLRAYAQAVEYLSHKNDPERRALLYYKMSRCEYLLGDVAAAEASNDSGLFEVADLPGNPVRFRLLARKLGLATIKAEPERIRAGLAEVENLPMQPPPELEPVLHGAVATAYTMLGENFARAELECLAAIAAAEKLGDAHELFGALNAAALMYSEFGEPSKAIQMCERGIEVATHAFLASDALIGMGNQIQHYFEFGDLATARKHLDRALAVPNLADMQFLAGTISALGILVGLHQGDAAFVSHVADESALQQILSVGSVRLLAASALAELHFSQGNITKAQQDFHHAASLSQTRDLSGSWLFSARFALVEDLMRIREVIKPWSERRTGWGPAFIGLLDCYIAKSQGKPDDAKRYAEVAVSSFAQGQSPLFEALGAELAGRRRDAIELYRRVGAYGDVARLDAELPHHGRRDRYSVELSGREREIVKLLTEGKSNKTIAAALVISERTVESHITSIFKKIGVSSRAELIARMAALQ